MGIFRRIFRSDSANNRDHRSILTVDRNSEKVTEERPDGNAADTIVQDDRPTAPIPETLFKNDSEKATFLCLEIISGKWAGMGATRADAKDFAEVYLSGFSFDSKERDSEIELKSVQFFYSLQLALMSRKPSKDFYRIQQYPPFSTRTLRTFVSLFSAFRTGGAESFSRTFDVIFPQGYSYEQEAEPVAIIGDNTGESPENAIEIRIIGPNSGLTQLPRWKIGSQAEYWYLCFNYGMRGEEWTFDVHKSLVPNEGREYSQINIKLRDGREREVYFDITDFRGDTRFERNLT